MSFFKELKRRNVIRVAAAYTVVSWLLLQVVDTLGPMFEVSNAFGRGVFLLLLLGLPVVLIISWVFEFTEEGIKTQAVADESGIQTSSSKLNAVVISGLALVVVFMALDNYVFTDDVVQSESNETAGMDMEAEPSLPILPPVTTDQTLAVLPFDNLSSDTEQEYFADGISEELMNKLTRLNGLQVAGRTSSFYFKDRNDDLATVGDMLGVEYILEGSVRKGGDQVRITAQLINAQTGFNLWTETYERNMEDIFAIQDEIAEAVATALSITMGVGDLGRLPGMTRNVEAYDLFLKVMSAGPSQYDSNREVLLQALAIDPEFALAWEFMARSAHTSLLLVDLEELEDRRAIRDEALSTALALAPESESIQALGALMESRMGNWSKAQQIYQNIALNSRNKDVLFAYGAMLQAAGKSREAAVYLERASLLDPLDPLLLNVLLTSYAATGQFERVYAEIERVYALGMSGLHGAVALVASLAQDDKATTKYWGDLLNAGEPVGAFINVPMIALLDDPEAAIERLHRIYQGSDQSSVVVSFATGVWAAYFGDDDLAEKAYLGSVETDSINMVSNWQPVLKTVRSTDAFKQKMQDMGLVDYWKATGWNDFCQPIPNTEDDFECN